jgi:hypothetical protein
MLRKAVNLTNIGRAVPRDDSILKSTERYHNILQDNTNNQHEKYLKKLQEVPLYFR